MTTITLNWSSHYYPEGFGYNITIAPYLRQAFKLLCYYLTLLLAFRKRSKKNTRLEVKIY